MADKITAPINYPIIAGGKILKGGFVVFGESNIRPDPDNPTTLKSIYLDSGLTLEADNPQGISSDGVFDQSISGVLFGETNDTYSVLIIDQNGKELSYIPEYSLSDANSAANAQQSATDAANSASQAASSESNAASSAASASSSLVEFTNTYWGEYASEPALSPNGEAATTGDLYFNTTTGGMLVYNETQWTALSSAVNGLRSEQGFTNSMGQDTFPFDYDPNYVEAYLNGSKLVKGVDFDGTSGTQIVLSAPLVSNTDYLVLVAFNNVDFADLGTAAAADVQTSPTDTTAGRLMAVGAFGLGVTGPVASDIDSVDDGAHFSFVTGVTSGDIPFPSGSGFQYARGSTRKTQIAFEDGSSPEGGVSIRNFSGTWSAWQPVYTGANYQPETINGVGVVRFMRNSSGSNFNAASTISGASLRNYYIDSSNNLTPFASGEPGTWKNVGTTVSNNQGTLCVRIA